MEEANPLILAVGCYCGVINDLLHQCAAGISPHSQQHSARLDLEAASLISVTISVNAVNNIQWCVQTMAAKYMFVCLVNLCKPTSHWDDIKQRCYDGDCEKQNNE